MVLQFAAIPQPVAHLADPQPLWIWPDTDVASSVAPVPQNEQTEAQQSASGCHLCRLLADGSPAGQVRRFRNQLGRQCRVGGEGLRQVHLREDTFQMPSQDDYWFQYRRERSRGNCLCRATPVGSAGCADLSELDLLYMINRTCVIWSGTTPAACISCHTLQRRLGQGQGNTHCPPDLDSCCGEHHAPR